MPVSSVGCRTGANLELWLVGTSSAIRPGLLGPPVEVRVGAADVPEDGWDLPLLAEQPEVLADRERVGELGDPVGSEVSAERVADVGGLRIVDGERRNGRSR
jgi:hypothetical protein